MEAAYSATNAAASATDALLGKMTKLEQSTFHTNMPPPPKRKPDPFWEQNFRDAYKQ